MSEIPVLPSFAPKAPFTINANGQVVFNKAPIMPGGGVGVEGPAVSVVGHMATWNATDGSLLADGGVVPAGDVVGPAGATAGAAAVFSGVTGKLIADSKVVLTAPATGVTLTIADGKTITFSNTLTFTGTDGSSVAFGAGGTIGAVGYSVLGQIAATATNDSAAAGKVGEFLSANVAAGTPVALANGTPKTITSVALTAGDWDVEGQVIFLPAAGTTIIAIIACISQNDNTLDTPGPALASQSQLQLSFTAGLNQQLSATRVRISTAAGQTVYLVGQASFGVSTMSGAGFISARRVR